MPDAVFWAHGERVELVPLPAPSDQEVESICAPVARRVLRLVEARLEGGVDPSEDDAALVQVPTPWPLPWAGRDEDEFEHPTRRRRRCAQFEGFSLHADVAVAEKDRAGLERRSLVVPWALAPGCGHGAAMCAAPAPDRDQLRVRARARAPHHDPITPDTIRGYPPVPGQSSELLYLLAPMPAIEDLLPTRQRRLNWAALLARVQALDLLACEWRCSWWWWWCSS